MMHLQFEEAAVLVIQNLHGVNEDGSTPHFTVQVLMNSTQQFGPSSLRELSVRLSPLQFVFKFICSCLLRSLVSWHYLKQALEVCLQRDS